MLYHGTITPLGGMKLKKLITLLMLSMVLILAACGNDSAEGVKEEPKTEPKKVEVSIPVEKEVKQEVNEEMKAEQEIDTSVFEYAKDIKLTDAIDINNHVTIMVDMSEKTPPGLATQHVVLQSYDFIQQDDVKSAKTITIIVRQSEIKIAQYTVTSDRFIPNEDTPMSKVVIAASEIDFMTGEVKEFGKTMESW